MIPTSSSQDIPIFKAVAHAEKYQSGNWIANRLVRRFMETLLKTAVSTGCREVHEVGCGEGHILGMLHSGGFKVRGCDISDTSLAVAASESERHGMAIPLAHKSVYDLDPQQDTAELVMCCEVLEHLTDPEAALRKLLSVAKTDLIVSVPNEPIWHLLNMARGKYLNALGNTPGHFQHWTKKQFTQFVSAQAEIVAVHTPLPWTVIHCRPRRAGA
jgi:2-polyprenyl-3-methyl-5-hydroxy-6-metoxy-1,4-benzoquinol methylase